MVVWALVLLPVGMKPYDMTPLPSLAVPFLSTSTTTNSDIITTRNQSSTSSATSAFSGMKVLSKKDDDDMFMGGKNKGGGKNNKNSKNIIHNSNNDYNISNDNKKTNNISSRQVDVVHSYTECSAYCHSNKRVGDTEGGRGGEGERTRAYWLCQLPLSSVCLVSDQKVPVQDNFGPPNDALADIAHTSLLPVMSYLTSLAYGKIDRISTENFLSTFFKFK